MPNLASPTGKKVIYKIYDLAGAYVKTLPDIVISKPSFSWAINQGRGEMVIDLALEISDFAENWENTIIKFNYRIKVFINDVDTTGAVKIYDGYITFYEPVKQEDGTEYIRLHIVSTTKLLADKLVLDGTSTTLAFASVDPSNIAKNLLDRAGNVINYSGGTVAQTGTTVTYTFQYVTYMEALKTVLELCPSFWYWYVDAENYFWLQHSTFDTVDVKLMLGREVVDVRAAKSVEELYNSVYFVGGGSPQLYKLLQRTSSIMEYGQRDYKMQDGRVTVAATATTIMTKFLDEHDHPLSLLTAKVVDNNIVTGIGYDIESLHPGMTVQVNDPTQSFSITLWDIAIWDVDFWDFDVRYSLNLPMQLVQIDYDYDSATLHLSSLATDVIHRIEDINRNVEVSLSGNLPTAPS